MTSEDLEAAKRALGGVGSSLAKARTGGDSGTTAAVERAVEKLAEAVTAIVLHLEKQSESGPDDAPITPPVE